MADSIISQRTSPVITELLSLRLLLEYTKCLSKYFTTCRVSSQVATSFTLVIMQDKLLAYLFILLLFFFFFTVDNVNFSSGFLFNCFIFFIASLSFALLSLLEKLHRAVW